MDSERETMLPPLVWTEKDTADMQRAFVRRFGGPLPRTESLYAVAAVGYRKALRFFEQREAGSKGREAVVWTWVHPDGDSGEWWSNSPENEGYKTRMANEGCAIRYAYALAAAPSGEVG